MPEQWGIEQSVSRDLHGKFLEAINDRDLFRLIVRGWGVLEDVLERHIAAALAEPLDQLDAAPFRHKLNLAIALGLVEPRARGGLAALNTMRNKLAHAEREPDTITVEEARSICNSLDPDGHVRALSTTTTAGEWARLALVAALTAIETSAIVARQIRVREREALRNELRAQAIPSPLILALLEHDSSGADDSPTPDSG